MKQFMLLLIALASASASIITYADDAPLKQAGSLLSSLKNALDTKHTTIALPLPSMPRATATQEQALKDQLAANIDDPLTATARSAATATITHVLSLMACSNENTPLMHYQQYLAPGVTYSAGFFTPRRGLHYHPQSECLTVSRLEGWVMPARNAIQFHAQYQSDSSGESSSYAYELIRQPDGSWLFSGARSM